MSNVLLKQSLGLRKVTDGVVLAGKLAAASYTSGDTIVVPGVSENSLLSAKFVADTASPVTVEVFRGADLASPLALTAANAGVEVDIYYYIVTSKRGGGSALRVTVELGS